jgi:hypothetical protein
VKVVCTFADSLKFGTCIFLLVSSCLATRIFEHRVDGAMQDGPARISDPSTLSP